MNSPELLTLARAVLTKNSPEKRDSTWDSRGTPAKIVSQTVQRLGTPKSEQNHSSNPTVPLSQTLGTGTVGQSEKSGTALGTVVGQHYVTALAELRAERPALIGPARWQQAIIDAENFLATWAAQAHALGWTGRDLFGLHALPVNRAPRYRRLVRYDETGLIWLLQGRAVVALTGNEAALQGASAVMVYRKPAICRVGDGGSE